MKVIINPIRRQNPEIIQIRPILKMAFWYKQVTILKVYITPYMDCIDGFVM